MKLFEFSQGLGDLVRHIVVSGRNFLDHYSSILMLSLVYGTTRFLGGLFTLMTFAGYGPGLAFFQEQGRFTLAGAYPFLDYWMEYPPFFPFMNVAAYRLSILIPGDSLLWFGTFKRWILIPFDVGGVVLIYLIARRPGASDKKALVTALLYSAAFVVLYVPLGFYESLPLFWLLLALHFALAYRPIWSGLAAGLGFLTKPFPVLVLPMAWQRLSSWGDRLRLILSAVAGVLLPMLPFILFNPDTSLAYLRNLLSRSSYETVWALLDGYRSFGVVAPLEARFDPGTAGWQAHSGDAGYGLWATIGFGILFLFLWTRRIDWRDNKRAVAFVGLTYCIFILWSRGYSPQWAIHFVPFVVLLMPNLRGAFYLLLIAIGVVGEWPGAFVLAWGQQWYFDAIVIWRTALTVLLSLEFGTIMLATAKKTDIYRRVYAALAGLLLAGLLVMGIRVTRQYFAMELTTEPLRSAISLLQSEVTSESGLVCRDIEVCERLSPYFPRLDMHWVPSPDSWQAGALEEFARSHPDLWSVEEFKKRTGHDVTVESWLSERYGKVSQAWMDGARIVRYVGADHPDPEPAGVRFGNGINLSGYALGQDGRYLNVLLMWENAEAIDSPHKPFIHVVDSQGSLVAQNDQYPAGDFRPPNEWLPGSQIRDIHGLILPEGLSGEHQIRIGWYNPDTGERAIIQAPLHLEGDEYFQIPLIQPAE